MSPASTVRRDQRGALAVPYPGTQPYPSADLLVMLSKEIVVDWQLPADHERKN